MTEIIVRYKDGNDHMAVRGGEYVQDLVRCKNCKNTVERATKIEGYTYCSFLVGWIADDFYCGYGEVRDE